MAKDPGLKQTHSTALGEGSKLAAAQKELKRRTNKRKEKKNEFSGLFPVQLP